MSRLVRGSPGTLDLLAQGILLRRYLRREILRLVKRADFEVGRAGHRIGGPLPPLDRLLHRPPLQKPEPRHELLGLGEWTIRNGALGAVEMDPLAELAGLEPVSGEHDPRLHQFFIVFPHLLENLGHFLRRGGLVLRVRRCLYDHHHAHNASSSLARPVTSGPSLMRRMGTGNFDIRRSFTRLVTSSVAWTDSIYILTAGEATDDGASTKKSQGADECEFCQGDID